ncbi:MAG: hypothetical protein RL233_1711 [Bacteroidota bacterium]|jgi:uncharacterized SAM-binding protein YcdF (DUF218 family)
MFFIASKILSFLLKPLFWLVLLLVLLLLPRFANKRRRIVLIALGILFVTGNSVLINEMALLWEPLPYQVNGKMDMPKARVCVILGGYSGFDHERNRMGFSNASERFFTPLKGMINQTVDTVILTGGSASVISKKYYESIYAKNLMKEFGIKENRIFIDAKSRNTYENAIETKRILDSLQVTDSVILITSAFHMNRAEACFQKAGVKFIPYPVHYIGNATRDYDIEAFLVPSAGAINDFQTMFREWIGIISYKMTGKI